jgi:arylsulfatase A-like enzyme/Tfp pilus assembly protein PilF
VSRPIRFTFILVLFALGTALAAVGGGRYARASAPVPGPIILISIDTLRADHLAAYGYRNGLTPAIDTLARDGVVFERAYSHASQTLPAHVAMLSGRLPFDTGVRDDRDAGVKPGERLLAQMLHDRGYATAGIVSAGVLRRETGVSQGFDFFDDKIAASAADPAIGGRQRDGGESEANAERWLQAAGSNRLFLFLHLDDPHAPYAAPARFDALDAYDGEIAYADEVVGRLLRYLKTHQLYDQSTIVLTSDHGEGRGDHGEQEHGAFVYDEIVHVPLIVKQASGVGAGRRVRTPVQHVDIAPTVLDLAKAPGAGNLRGRSLKALLDGSGDVAPRPIYSEAAYGERRFGWAPIAALTDGRFRYIRAPREELYDLEADPHERHNLAGLVEEETERLVRLRQTLERLAGARPLAEEAAVDPKDHVRIVEIYRGALKLAAARNWARAIGVLQQVVDDEPQAVAVWADLADLATRAGRLDVALGAWQRVSDLQPSDPAGCLGAASVLIKSRRFEDARAQVEEAAARSDRDAASAAVARATMTFIEARLVLDQGHYEEALALLERANGELKPARGRQIADLHYVTGDTLERLERADEAEAEFLEELRHYPHNVRARAALAALYQASGRDDEAARQASELTRFTPTPEAYTLAARIWTSLGDRAQADATRAEARRLTAAH